MVGGGGRKEGIMYTFVNCVFRAVVIPPLKLNRRFVTSLHRDCDLCLVSVSKTDPLENVIALISEVSVPSMHNTRTADEFA